MISPRLYLIRHGETEWSISGQHTGRSDIPLTAKGENEVEKLGHRINSIPFSHVFTSPLQRALRTFELSGLSIEAEIALDLAEWDYGDYEGKHTAGIRNERPDWNVFRDGCPQGETPSEISERADRLIARLRNLDGNIALFSHGQFGNVLGMRWIGLPVIDGQYFPLSTASLSILGYEPSHPEVPVMELWNSIGSF